MVTGGADAVARRPDVEWVELDGEAVVYDPTSETLHRLNAGATAVWAACDGSGSVDEIVGAVRGAYAGSADAIAEDVRALILRFRRAGLLAGPRAPA